MSHRKKPPRASSKLASGSSRRSAALRAWARRDRLQPLHIRPDRSSSSKERTAGGEVVEAAAAVVAATRDLPPGRACRDPAQAQAGPESWRRSQATGCWRRPHTAPGVRAGRRSPAGGKPRPPRPAGYAAGQLGQPRRLSGKVTPVGFWKVGWCRERRAGAGRPLPGVDD